MKKLATFILVLGATFCLTPGIAYAWTMQLVGNTSCVAGSSKATFTLNNSTETQTMTVQASNHPDLVPIGTTVIGKGSFTTAAVLTPYTLTIGVNWPGDLKIRSYTVSSPGLTCAATTTTSSSSTSTSTSTSTTTTTVVRTTTSTVPSTTTSSTPAATTTTSSAPVTTTTSVPAITTTTTATAVLTPQLPKTGAHVAPLLRLGLAFLAAGGLLLLAAARTRRDNDYY